MKRQSATIRLTWALVVAAAAGPGCDGLTAPPGPPPSAPLAETTKVALFLPAEGLAELERWESTARREEQRARMLVDVHRMAPGDPPESQAEAIRRAVSEGVSGVVVMAADPKAVAPALEEARTEGVAVVLLDRDVPVTGPPLPRVAYTPPAETAKTLVDAAMADAREAGFPPEGPAIVLVHALADANGRARARALRDELEGRGVRVLPFVRFEGTNDQASAALGAVFPSVPHLAMVFAEDDLALKGASTFRHALDRKERRFVLAGYTHEFRTMDLVRFNICAAVADRNVEEPIRRAFATVQEILRGETVPDVVVAQVPVTRAAGKEKEGVVPPFLSMAQYADLVGGGTGMPVDDHLDDHNFKD